MPKIFIFFDRHKSVLPALSVFYSTCCIIFTPMNILETPRLTMREFVEDDAEFVLELMNDPGWISQLGDKGIRTVEGAREFIVTRYLNSYEKFGFGFYLVALKDSGASIGLCGLIKRDSLEDVDIGFGFMERFWGKGYATESAAAVLNLGKNKLGIKRIVGITSLTNDASANVLEKIGLKFEKIINVPEYGDERLYG
jgi:RimJ/RimL family protein N-acetyltransferase